MAEKENQPRTRPQLELVDYRLRHFYIQENPGFNAEEQIQGGVSLTSAVAVAEDDQQMFRLTLGSAFQAQEGGNYPFIMEVAIEGDFRSAYPTKEGRIPTFLASNAMLILWGIARGVAGPVTALFDQGLFVWPTVSFEDFAAGAAGKANSGISDFATPEEYVSFLKKPAGSKKSKRRGSAIASRG